MTIDVTFDGEDADEIRQAADRAGMSPERWVRRAVTIRLAVEGPRRAHDVGDRDPRSDTEHIRVSLERDLDDADPGDDRGWGERARRQRFED